jgi:hypothetical protein
MNYYLAMFTEGKKVIQHGWIMAESADELVNYARTMNYGITLTYLGEADMKSYACSLVPGTESPAALMIMQAGKRMD